MTPCGGYVVVADVVGGQWYYMVLEPHQVSDNGSGGTQDEILVGKLNPSQNATYYKVVSYVAGPLDQGQTPEGFQSATLAPAAALNRVQAYVANVANGQAQEFNQRLGMLVTLLPLVGTANNIAHGNYWDAAVSFADDVAFFTGAGAAWRAGRCVYAGVRSVRLAGIASSVIQGGAALIRMRQGFQALGNGNTADALGYFGDATLRLFGLSAQAIAWLRQPKCFVAGTPVQTEHGPRPIENIVVGERVWGYDRQQQSWRLCPVTRTFQRVSHLLTTLRLADGEEITGTDGHPFWMIEGEGMGARAGGDHGAEEIAGPTPGRWVAMHALKPGDVVLTRLGRTGRVETINTRPEAVAVYNLEVEGLHSYAVGQNGILVHNAGNGYTDATAALARQAPPTVAQPRVADSTVGAVPKPSRPGGGALAAAAIEAPAAQAPTTPATTALDRSARRPGRARVGDILPENRTNIVRQTKVEISAADQAAMQAQIDARNQAVQTAVKGRETTGGRNRPPASAQVMNCTQVTSSGVVVKRPPCG